jgi:hypothetical protein
MPHPVMEYDVIPASPPEPNVTFLIPTGESISFTVWHDHKSGDKERVMPAIA